MFPTITKVVKWVAFPMLLAASMLGRYAAAYEGPVNLAICLGTIVLIERAVRLKDYFRAAGFVGVAIIFSPLLLVDKIFLLLGFASVFTLLILVATFRRQAPVVIPC